MKKSKFIYILFAALYVPWCLGALLLSDEQYNKLNVCMDSSFQYFNKIHFYENGSPDLQKMMEVIVRVELAWFVAKCAHKLEGVDPDFAERTIFNKVNEFYKSHTKASYKAHVTSRASFIRALDSREKDIIHNFFSQNALEYALKKIDKELKERGVDDFLYGTYKELSQLFEYGFEWVQSKFVPDIKYPYALEVQQLFKIFSSVPLAFAHLSLSISLA